jgi:hypothetical protein
MNPAYCDNVTVSRIIKILIPLLPTIETNQRIRLIEDLSRINLQFLELIDYQLQEPPNPE